MDKSSPFSQFGDFAAPFLELLIFQLKLECCVNERANYFLPYIARKLFQ